MMRGNGSERCRTEGRRRVREENEWSSLPSEREEPGADCPRHRVTVNEYK